MPSLQAVRKFPLGTVLRRGLDVVYPEYDIEETYQGIKQGTTGVGVDIYTRSKEPDDAFIKMNQFQAYTPYLAILGVGLLIFFLIK